MDKSKFNKKSEWRKFGIALGIILAIIASIMLYKGNALHVYFYGAGLFFLLVAFVLPVIIKPVFIMFLYIGHVMGWIMTRVILGILFYLVLTPISLIGRLVGKRFLDLRFSRKEDSYWIKSSEGVEDIGVKDYENQY